MLAGSLLIGFAVVMVALWLEYNDSRGWPSEQALEQEAVFKPNGESDQRYLTTRRRWRKINHVILAVCGAMMASAGLAGRGAYWVSAWTAVAILMFSIILIALMDAIRTQRYYAAKIARRDSRGDKLR